MDTKVLELLKGRHAWRAFSDRPVEEDKIEAMLRAAQLSASCKNSQSWRFLVLTAPEALEQGRAALSEGNYWARTAPVLFIGFSRPDLDCIQADGRRYHLFDLGMAVQNLLLQASEFDLVARPMAGFSPAKVREAWPIPEDHDIQVMIAVGYQGDLSLLKEYHQKVSTAPRSRRPLEQNFFFNRLPEPLAS